MGLESINLADKLAKFSDYHSMADRPRVHAIDRPRDVQPIAARCPAQRPAIEPQPRRLDIGRDADGLRRRIRSGIVPVEAGNLSLSLALLSLALLSSNRASLAMMMMQRPSWEHVDGSKIRPEPEGSSQVDGVKRPYGGRLDRCGAL